MHCGGRSSLKALERPWRVHRGLARLRPSNAPKREQTLANSKGKESLGQAVTGKALRSLAASTANERPRSNS